MRGLRLKKVLELIRRVRIDERIGMNEESENL